MTSKFKEVTASKSSLSMRKLLYGVGVNDAWYNVTCTFNGKVEKCPYYERWQSMLSRCYSLHYLSRKPTYKGCSVIDEWKVFSNFRKWMEKQDWFGKHLDKDLLVVGNKVYSPSTCVFISLSLNNLLLDSKNSRGKYPQGVYWNKGNSKYMARCYNKGRQEFLGYFSCVKQAEIAYCKKKSEVILTESACLPEDQSNLQEALAERVVTLTDRVGYLTLESQ